MKTKIIKCLLTLILSYLTCEIIGCVDTSFQTENNLTGKIYQNDGFPLNGYQINNNNFGSTPTRSDGSFSLNYAPRPFDIDIMGQFGNNNFKNININNPQIVTSIRNNDSYNCYAPLKFPYFSLDSGQILILTFVSSDIFRQYQTRYFYSEQASVLSLLIPDNNLSIQGKLVFLQMKFKQNRFISYDKCGVKDININKGSNDTIKFTEEDINYNPPEENININIVNPPEVSVQFPEIYLNLLDYHNNQGIDLSDVYDRSNHTAKVPIIPFLYYNFKVVALSGSYGSSLGKKWGYVNAGGNVTLVVDKAPVLISPVEGDSTIVDTTTFSIKDDNNIHAVYIYHIIDDDNLTEVSEYVTTKKSLKFLDFKTNGYGLFPQRPYDWFVEVFSQYNSVDEFVSSPYIYSEKSNGSNVTRISYFRTRK